MYDRILHPTDGSDVARAATEAAVALAERFDATLHVVTVTELGALPAGYEDELADVYTEVAERAVSDARTVAADAGVEVRTAVLRGGGSVHDGVLEYADREAVDCIVVGTHGRTGLDRYLLGSVAEMLLRESPVPVMTVHEDTTVSTDPEGILVATDGSDCAEAAAEHAIEYAIATGAQLHVLHVVDVSGPWEGLEVSDVLESLEAAGERAIDRVVDRAETREVPSVTASVSTGPPHRAILDYLADTDVDAVFMGTHGRTGLERVLLGSVTERVVRLAEVPVVAVKDGESTG